MIDFLVNDRVKEARQSLNLSQVEFASGLGWSRGVIANFEGHLTEPNELQLRLICKVYGVSYEYLAFGEGTLFPPKSLGDQMGELAAAAAKNNADTIREIFRRLPEKFTDAEILMLYQIYKNHIDKQG